MTPCWVLRNETEEKLIVDETSGNLYFIYRSTDSRGNSDLVLSTYTPEDTIRQSTTASLEGR